MPKMITANDLATGSVVYLAAGDAWVKHVDAAIEYADDAAAEDGLAVGRRDAARNLIVDPFVTEKGGGGRKMTLRESIRAGGPTIDYRSR